MTHTKSAVQFFHEHAGYSWNPTQGETQEHGHERTARELATAEQWAREKLEYIWQPDPCADSSEFHDGPVYGLWECIAVWAPWSDYEGDYVYAASLHAIDFGPDGCPWSDPYKRVVEAELAIEGMASVESN